MNRYAIALAAALALGACPALAASPEVEAAVKALAQIEGDPAKLQGYCKIVKDMGAAGEDEAKYDALEQQLEELLRSFGPQFEQIIAVSETIDSESADGQALDAAFDQLDGKCGS